MLRTSLRKSCGQLLRSSGAQRCSALASARRPVAASTSFLQKRHAMSSAPAHNDSFLSGSTANYIDEMYLQWKEDPKSVHVSWQVYFKNMESGDMPIQQAFQPPPTLVPGATGGVGAAVPGG